MTQQILYDYAISMLGLPYQWGGDDAIKGYDCSGLVIELLTAGGLFGKGYDASAQQIHNELVKRGALNFVPSLGAIAFFGMTTSSITHTAFCLSDFLMLEAGGGGSSTITREDAIQQNAFIRIRPIDLRKDRVAILKPKYPWENK